MKKAKRRAVKVLSVFLAAAALVSQIAGCKVKTAEEGDFENAPQVYFARKNTFESKIGNAGDNYEDNDYIRYIYDKTGIRVVPVMLATGTSEANQQLAIKRAGGQQVDLIINWDLAQDYIQSGQIIKLNELLEQYKDSAPNITNNIPESAWKGTKKLDDIWGFPSRPVLPNAPITYIFLRKDWMDKLNLSMPETTDEFFEVLKAFTENDPDGNGKKDTYGLIHDGSSTVNLLAMFFGVDTYREDIVDGNKLISQAMTDRARTVFSELRRWNQAGVICEDGITNASSVEHMYANSKIGAYIGRLDTLVKYQKSIKENGDVNSEWVMIPNTIQCSLDGNTYGFGMPVNHAAVTMITSSAKNYEDIFKLLNWMYSEEGTFFQTYGIEGKEYTLGSDGKPVVNQDYMDKKSYIGMFTMGKSYNTFFEEEAQRMYGTDELALKYIDDTVNNSEKYWTPRTDIKYNFPTLEEFSTYPDWRKGIENNMLHFVVGDKDPADDSVWNAYLSECNSYGIQKLMDAAAEKYFNQ